MSTIHGTFPISSSICCISYVPYYYVSIFQTISLWSRHGFTNQIFNQWEHLCQVQQKQMNCGNAHENRNHIEHKYKKGDKVLVDNKSCMMPKLDVLCNGPYLVKKVESNGNSQSKRTTYKKD